MGSDAPTTMTCDFSATRERAWKSKPSWYLQVRDDKMIPYPAQQFMAKRAGATVVEVPGSHAIYVSNPKAVADVIEQAASGIK
jgi:pimeloyl-ACP methyl ester carboxylesterase